MKKMLRFVVGLAVLFLAAVVNAAVIDAPHNLTNGIGCESCHSYSLWWQYSPSADPDQTADGLCQTCHGTGGSAPFKAPHNSLSMGKVAGLWGTHCVDCHDPHLQPQLEWRLTAADKDGLYLAQGTIGTVATPVNGATTFGYTLNTEKTSPHWVSPDSWSNKTSPGRGLILVDDTDLAKNTFSVVAATDNTITVKGVVNSASEGNSFGLIYGQLVKKTIDTPAGQARTVKFFDPNILNSPGGFTDSNTPPQGVCQVCHSSTQYWQSDGQNADPGTGPHNPTIVCTACHLANTGFKPSGGPHTFLGETTGCMACHPSGDILGVHKNNCQNCHTTPPALADPNDKPLVIQIGKGDCQFCHGAAAHNSAHNHRQTVSFCAECHAISTPEAVNTLHTNDCRTCHAYTGTKLNPTTVAAVIASGQGVDGTDVNCRSCHDDKGALHHLQANAVSGNCTACHIDPRPSRTGVHPGDNGGTAQYPTQLACKQCHVTVINNTIYVTKFPHDLEDNIAAKGQYGQHTINGITNGQIQNYGACLSCHDGSTATKVTVFHGRPAHRYASSMDMRLVPPPGRGSFNIFYNSLKYPGADDYHLGDLYNTTSGSSHYGDTSWTKRNPMVSFKWISIPCNAASGCTSGTTRSVPVLPALGVPSTLHIDSIWPPSGQKGIPVTLAGTFNEGSAPQVYIDKASAPATSWTATTVTFTMPTTLSSSDYNRHPVMVKANGNNSNTVVFTVKGGVDSDLDGVDDTLDTCPNTPSMTQVNSVGCPSSTISMASSRSSVMENAGTATITVVRTGNPTGTASANYTTYNGWGTAGIHYVATSGTLNWADGDLAPKTFTVTILDNAVNGGNKTVGLSMSSVSGASYGTPNTTELTIVDDDAPPVSTIALTSATYSLNENAGWATISISRTGNSSGSAYVNYATTTGGTATAGTDYWTKSGSLAWNDGDLSTKTFSIGILNNAVYGGNKTVTLALSSVFGAAIVGRPSTAVLTIVDDEVPPATIALSSATYSANENAGAATITVSRTGNSTGAVSVNYATTTGGTAMEETDYSANSGTLNWDDGDLAAKTFTIAIADNGVYGGNKTIGLALSSVSGVATLGSPNTAELTIVDDETPPPATIVLTSGTYSVNENAGTATITASRTGNSTGIVSVNYATTTGGTATETDYTPTLGTLTWADGDLAAKTFAIPIIDNAIYAGEKTINLALSSVSGVAILGSPDTAVLTITDDETPPNNAPNTPTSLSCVTAPAAESTGNACTLTAASPTDPDGDTVSYVDGGSTCPSTVINASTGGATFTAPSTGATCLVKVKAFDSALYSSAASSTTITGNALGQVTFGYSTSTLNSGTLPSIVNHGSGHYTITVPNGVTKFNATINGAGVTAVIGSEALSSPALWAVLPV